MFILYLVPNRIKPLIPNRRVLGYRGGEGRGLEYVCHCAVVRLVLNGTCTATVLMHMQTALLNRIF